jgi:hypothetical protein
MSISDEAVEAAKVAFDETNGGLFEDEYAFNVARRVLEAAAPHIALEAWEQGRVDGYHHRPNPYKETK